MSDTQDAAGRIASMTDYNGLTTNCTYTARGELATMSAPGGKVWTFAYNALGQRTQYTHPNGIRTEYGYDSQNRLASILHKDTITNAVLDGFTYTLNDGGGITRIDHVDASYWTYAYGNDDWSAKTDRVPCERAACDLPHLVEGKFALRVIPSLRTRMSCAW